MLQEVLQAQRQRGADGTKKGLEGGLGGASKGLHEAVTAANEADWQSMVDALNSADPSKWGAAVTEAHDLLLARYQAEIALIQEITVAIDTLGAAATTAVSTMSRLQDLGIKIPGAMEFASFASTALSQSFAEGFTGRTPIMALTQGRSAVDVFAAQSMMAAKAMDLPGMEAAAGKDSVGREASCRIEHGGRAYSGKALLEPTELARHGSTSVT